MHDDLPRDFEKDVGAYVQAARRLALTLVRDPDDADDVAQESMRVILQRPATEGGPVWPWLTGITRRTAWAFRRKKGR